MTMRSVRFENFTVFSEATFDFCSGVNVLIGQNGTGKSHVLKAAYALCQALGNMNKDPREAELGERSIVNSRYMEDVFLPSKGELSHLRRRGTLGSAYAAAELRWDSGKNSLWIYRDSTTEHHEPFNVPEALFLPPREVLSMFPGFVEIWKRYKLQFDRTYPDLCEALRAPLLRQIPDVLAGLLPPLEQVLGGKILLRNDSFLLQRKDGEMEMSLVAEGFRKLATILYLLSNDSLKPGGYLFWDEPEANMNPKLVVVLTEFLLGLARAGIQVVLATHDFLLSRELSLASEYGLAPGQVRFFCLTQSDPEAPVFVESGATLGDLDHNPIVEEFSAHYGREAALFASVARL